MSKPTRFDWLFRPHLADEDQPLSAEARFAEALAELPAVERSALALSEIGGLDTNEIAERLGTDPAVVQRLLARARESVRASLSGRRGLAALLPFQNLWQLGSSAPAVRAAGVVAAAVVAPSVVTGGAVADVPRAPVLTADPPAVRAVEDSHRTFTAPRAPITVARPAVPMTASDRAVEPRRRSARSSVRTHPGRDAAAVPARQPPRRVPVVPAAPAAEPRTPAQPPASRPEPEQPKPAAVPVPLPAPAPPVELPVVPPPLPVVPAPELPPPPPLPLPLP